MKNKLLLLVFLMSFVLMANDVSAYHTENLGDIEVVGNFDISPTSFSIDTDPGESFTKEIQVTNRSGKKKQYLIEIEDFEGSHQPDQTVSMQGDKSGRFSGRDWVKPEVMEFSLNHGERAYFDVDVKIPSNADAGDHYASVLVSTPAEYPEEKPDEEKSKSNVAVISRVGVLFFMRVNGKTTESGELKTFNNDKKWYEKAPVNFYLTFENTGSVRLRPFGEIRIKSQFGSPVDVVEVAPFNVLRDSLRGMNYTWDKKGFLFGYYTAVLNLENGYNGDVNTKSVSFWIIPWKQLAWGLGVLIIVMLGMIIIKKTLSFDIKVKRKKK